MGSALKKAGGALKRWGRKLTGGDKPAPAVAVAPPEAADDAVALDATIKKLSAIIGDEQQRLGGQLEIVDEQLRAVLDAANESSSSATALRGQQTA